MNSVRINPDMNPWPRDFLATPATSEIFAACVNAMMCFVHNIFNCFTIAFLNVYIYQSPTRYSFPGHKNQLSKKTRFLPPFFTRSGSVSVHDSFYAGAEYFRKLLVSQESREVNRVHIRVYLNKIHDFACAVVKSFFLVNNMNSFITKISCCYDMDWKPYLWSRYTQSAVRRSSFDVRRCATSLRWTTCDGRPSPRPRAGPGDPCQRQSQCFTSLGIGDIRPGTYVQVGPTSILPL